MPLTDFVVACLRALQADIDHQHAVVLVEIQRLDDGVGIELGIEGALVHPFVEEQRVGQADIHQLALRFVAIGGAGVGFLPIDRRASCARRRRAGRTGRPA